MDLDGPRWTSAAPTSLTLTILADVSVLNVSRSVGGLLASDQMSKEQKSKASVKHDGYTPFWRESEAWPSKVILQRK